VPGDVRVPFEHANQARQILNDAEDDLREWQPELEDANSSAQGMGHDLMPGTASQSSPISGELENGRATEGTTVAEGSHLSARNDAASRITSDTSVGTGPSYAPSESEAGIATHQHV